MRKKRRIELKKRPIEGRRQGVPYVQTLRCAKVAERLTKSPIRRLEAITNSSESKERSGNVYESTGA
jgi:hypothetical protein